MQKLRRWAAAALCGAAFAGSAAAVLAACAVCPGRAWIVRGALFLQDPAAAAAIAWPADAARAAYKPQKPDRRPTPVPTATPSPAPTAAATPTPEPSPASTPLPSAAPELDDAGRIRSVTLRQGSGDGYVALAAGSIRNSTEHTDADLRAAVTTQNLPFAVEKNSALPQVLIMHTHATESYEGYDSEYCDTRNTWRSTDNNENMVAVGNVIEEELRKAGIGVVHDTQQFDYPSYNGSYDRAAVAVKEYQAQYPDIQLILDVHRDGIQRDTTTIVKPATEIDGEPAAQIMILCGSDPGVGDWGENLRPAAAVTNLLESRYPTLTRPIYFSTGRYNMNLSGGTILLEFGSQANTLEEALTSARLTGQALGEWLQELAGNA